MISISMVYAVHVALTELEKFSGGSFKDCSERINMGSLENVKRFPKV